MIKVDSLRVQYGGFCAVEDISFNVSEQEIFGIIGPNGAGKTSAIECIEGLRKPFSGKISVLGLDPWRERKRLHQVIGVQLQDTVYQDNAKVWEICHLFSALYPHPANYHELLDIMGLTEKKQAFVSTLSGGQKQRLSIVLALIPKPKVVFLDELTTGLDPHARHQMWDLLKELRKDGLTIVIVSHFMDEIEAICDTVAVMNSGRMLIRGTVAEVSSRFNLGDKISFTAPQLQDGALAGLRHAISVTRDRDVITVLSKANEGVNEVLSFLKENEIAYSNLAVSRPGLEDVFLKLVEDSKVQEG
ncbi:MAG: ABC transporter ATP-binding protein [Eubacteriales bacterium]|nr:ABC transporter ATP-binding protein [Eubacteriales bacterium]